MELGLTTFAEINEPGLSPGERLRQVVEEAKLADQLGLDVYGIGEHHRADMAASAPEIVLAAIAGATKSIKLSSAVTVLSSADPVRVYQNFVTLDLVSGGRAELMAGRGSFTESFPLFGYSLSDYDELFTEKLDLLLRLRDDDPVSWSGPVPGAAGSGHRAPAGRGAAAADLDRGRRHAAIGGPGRHLGSAAGARDHRRAAGVLRTAGRSLPPSPGVRRPRSRHPVGRAAHGYVFDDEDAARAEFLPAYRRTFAAIGRERGWPPMSDAAVEALVGPEGALFFGRPETVADKVIKLHEQMDIDRFELHTSHVGHDLTMRSIELFATKVGGIVRERTKAP